MTEKVILIIKAANQSSVDQKLECDLDWKVLSLKEKISGIHPAKPSVEEQRLIYSGQLLQDSSDLRTVLRHPSDNNEYIIHMVCSTKKSASSPHSSQVSNHSASSSSTFQHVNNEITSRTEVIPESSTDGLRHRQTTSEQVPALGVQQGFDTSLYSTFPQLPLPLQAVTDPIQQMAMLQQMYAQYMSSYMQYIQSGNFESGRINQETFSPSTAPEVTGTTSGDSGNQDTNQRPQAQPPNNEQERQRNAQGRLIQGGALGEEEEEGGARDWLDYIYFAARMGVLLSIVYFYSTFTRFVVVAGITIMFYLYQAGVFRLRRLEAQPQAPVVQPVVDQMNANGAQPNDAPSQPAAQPGPEENGGGSEPLQGGEREDGEGIREDEEPSTLEGAAGSNEEGAEGQQQQSSTRNPIMEDLPPQQPSFLSLSWTLLTTFFTSLIPEQHQII